MARHDESLGLLRAVARSDAGYRRYRDKEVHTLSFIRRARDLGFSLPEIAEPLALWQNRRRTSASVKRIALAHVADLDRRIAEMAAMRNTLNHLADCCYGDQRPDCPILDQLAGRKLFQAAAPDTPRRPWSISAEPGQRREESGRHPALHGREIARRTGLAAGTLTRELVKLAEVGLLKREKRGNQQLYSANTNGPIYTELASILRKTSGLADVLVQAFHQTTTICWRMSGSGSALIGPICSDGRTLEMRRIGVG